MTGSHEYHLDLSAPVVLTIGYFIQRGSSPGHGLHGESLVSSSWHLCCAPRMDPFRVVILAFLPLYRITCPGHAQSFIVVGKQRIQAMDSFTESFKI